MFNYVRVMRLAYRAGMPIVSDDEYDKIIEENYFTEREEEFLSNTYDNDPIDEDLLLEYGLEEVLQILLEGQVSNSVPSTLQDADFSIRSVDNENSLYNWYSQFPPNSNFIVALKRDGVRGNPTYVPDTDNPTTLILDNVYSRGRRGVLVYNPTTHAYLPNKIQFKQSLDSVTISGEYTVEEDNLKEVEFIKERKYSSTLNAAVSIARTGLGFGKDDLLTFSAFRIFGLNLPSKIDELKILRMLRIPIIEHEVIYNCSSFEVILNTCNKVHALGIQSGIPNDGIVVSYSPNTENPQNELIAYKPRMWVTNTYKARIVDFEFEMVGRQSNAKIIVEPTKTREGKTISNVNAYNPSYILNKLKVGDIIEFRINSNNSVELVEGG